MAAAMGSNAHVPAALLLAAALLSCGRPASTIAPATPSQADPCRESGTQAELTICWGAEGRRAESEQQAVFNRATRLLRERTDAVALNALLQAETAWTTYRDAQCAAVTAIYEGGSLGAMQEARCRTLLAHERGENIQKLLTDVGR